MILVKITNIAITAHAMSLRLIRGTCDRINHNHKWSAPLSCTQLPRSADLLEVLDSCHILRKDICKTINKAFDPSSK